MKVILGTISLFLFFILYGMLSPSCQEDSFSVPKPTTSSSVVCEIGWCATNPYIIDKSEYPNNQCTEVFSEMFVPSSDLRSTDDLNSCMGLYVSNEDVSKQDTLFWVRYIPCNLEANEYQIYLNYSLGMAILQGNVESGFTQLTCFEAFNSILIEENIPVFKGKIDPTEDIYMVLESTLHSITLKIEETVE